MHQDLLPILSVMCCLFLDGLATAAGPQPERTTLRVVSYNIRRGLGTDNKTDITRAADVLRELNADIVGLQEVDNGVRRSGSTDQAKQLGEGLGMHHAFAEFLPYDGGRYGMAVLCRHPIVDVERFRLPEGNEPRVALIVKTQPPAGPPVYVVNVHFDWVSDDTYRFAQATTLRERLDTLNGPYVVLGDFNDTPGSRTLKLLSDGTTEADKPDDTAATFPSVKPKSEIDFIFASPADRWSASDVRVIAEPLASDHRPVAATLKLKSE